MKHDQSHDSLQTLQDIRSIMERSARFLSLSGWSGIWAGTVGLMGALIAGNWLSTLPADVNPVYNNDLSTDGYNSVVSRFVLLAVVMLVVALAGGLFFTWQKTKKQGFALWNSASRKMLVNIAMPLAVGGIFALEMLYNGHASYVTPVCLAFYGLSLINGSKYTLSDIQYLGISEVLLACISLFMPGYGLFFWAVGFGGLHILYGIIMWNKYDKRGTRK